MSQLDEEQDWIYGRNGDGWEEDDPPARPTLQQRVERLLDKVNYRYWHPDNIAYVLRRMNAGFAHDDEAEIAHAVSVWLRKVNG